MPFDSHPGSSRYSDLLLRFDALAPWAAWALGMVTGMVTVFAIDDSRGLWVALVLPLLAVGLTRGAGLRPEPKRRARGSLLTSLGLSIAVGGVVVTFGQTLAFVTPDRSAVSSSVDDALPELRLDLGIVPALGGTMGESPESDEETGADGSTGEPGTSTGSSDAETGTSGGSDYLSADGPSINQDPLSEPQPAPEPDDPPPTRRTCPSGMVLLDGGAFKGRDGKRHEVPPFCLDTTEVRVSAYRRCLDAGRDSKRGCMGGGVRVKTKGQEEGGQWDPHCNLAAQDKDAHPINCVDYSQARAFCRWVGKDLPTEWEWEWAARGGTRRNRYPWGNEPSPSCNVTVMADGGDGCGRGGSWPVGTMARDETPDGIKDMGGNVEEWTSSSKGGKRVLRGGSWNIRRDDRFDVSNRQQGNPNDSFFYVGFRCADEPRRE